MGMRDEHGGECPYCGQGIGEVERLSVAAGILQKLSVNRALFARFADLETLTDEEFDYLAAVAAGVETDR